MTTHGRSCHNPVRGNGRTDSSLSHAFTLQIVSLEQKQRVQAKELSKDVSLSANFIVHSEHYRAVDVSTCEHESVTRERLANSLYPLLQFSVSE